MGRQILIADNDALVRTLLSEALLEQGYQVALAADGMEAWRQIQMHPPDYLILDLIMPQLDGARLCRYVKSDARFSGVHVFVLTATAAEAAGELPGLGADGYFAKRAAADMVADLLHAIGEHEERGHAAASGTLHTPTEVQPRQIVHELLAETAHLTAILQHLGEGVVLLDEAGRILFVNPAGERLLGAADRALAGSVLDGVLDPPDGERLSAALDELVGQPGVPTLQLQIVHRDQALLATATQLCENGRPRTCLLLLRNVSSFVQRIEELMTLNELGSIFASTVELDTLLHQVMGRVQAAMQVEAGSLFLTDAATGELVVRVAVGPHRQRVGGFRLAPGQGVAGWVCRAGVPIVVPDAYLDPRFYPGVDALTGFRTRALLCVPLRVRETTIGVIQVIHDRPDRSFSTENLNLLSAIASQAAVAIENARLHAAARRHAGQMATLNTLTRTLTTTLDPARLSQEIVSTIRVLMPEVAVRLWAPRQEGDEALQLIASDGLRDPQAGQQLRVRVGEGLIGLAAVTRQPASSPDVRTDPRFINRDWAAREGLISSIMLPLVYGERLHGVLTISTRTPQVFSAEEQDLLRAFAVQAAVAMENARLFTELNDSYLRLQQAQEELVRAEKLRALGQMATGIAHDLNNMLAAILGQADVMKLRVEDPAVRENLHRLETAAKDGAHVVRRLQDFARQRSVVPLGPCDSAQVIREALDLTRPHWEDLPQRGGYSIQVHTVLGEVPPILGHPAELREALTNIILNAVDAMPRGGMLSIGTARVPTHAAAAGMPNVPPAAQLAGAFRAPRLRHSGQAYSAEWVEVSVSDTGLGMSEEVRGRIFDPFFTTKGVSGTGLGLSVVYGIVERHGGQIEVTSTPGLGTTVTLRFQASAGQPPLSPPPVAAPAISRRILLIDDEGSVREAITEYLRLMGHIVMEAENGAAGLARLREGAVDLVLTDLGMPGMTGWDVARAVQASHPGLPVVLLTGWGHQVAPETEVGRLVARILRKPVPLEELQQLIDDLTREQDTRTD